MNGFTTTWCCLLRDLCFNFLPDTFTTAFHVELMFQFATAISACDLCMHMGESRRK